MDIVVTPEERAARRFENAAVTVGVFDGVHRGHAEVIRRLAGIKSAGAHRASILVTFDRHPLTVTHPEMAPPLLTTLDEKLHVLAGFDIDAVVVERFTAETARIGWMEYAARLQAELGMRHLVVGYDFRMGRGREGSQELLVEAGRARGFGVTIVPPVVLQGSVVSSTKIRRDVVERRLEHAARSLGRPYFFDASVVRGDGVGRALGFPTANAEIADPHKLLPARGAYAVEVEAQGERRGGMMNVGFAPTVRADAVRRIEVHLFEFSGELYGERIRVHCRSFLREERRFADREELRAQLLQDERAARSALEKKH